MSKCKTEIQTCSNCGGSGVYIHPGEINQHAGETYNCSSCGGDGNFIGYKWNYKNKGKRGSGQIRSTYCEDTDYDGSKYWNHTKDEPVKKGCFLTTAACMYKNLPDTCDELEILRSFRDNYLLRTSEGRELIDKYYRISPRIIEKVNSDEYEYVWSIIQKSSTLIKDHMHNEAKLLYQEMVTNLAKKYSIELSSD